jgi:hypothetical protein
MNKILGVALVGVIILIVGVVVFDNTRHERKAASWANPAMSRICHRYIAKQSTALPHLAITKFINNSGEVGGYADQSFTAEGQFEGALYDKDGNEINLGIPYGTGSKDARNDLTVKANDWLKKMKADYQTETMSWCDE